MAGRLDEVASFFQMKYVAIKCGHREAIASLYTDTSRKKFLDWLKTGNQTYLDSHFTSMAAVRRRVRFVIDADPVYIVLYDRDVGTKNRLAYEYVIRDENDGKLKFTKLYFGGFFDQMVRSREFLDTLAATVLGEKKAG